VTNGLDGLVLECAVSKGRKREKSGQSAALLSPSRGGVRTFPQVTKKSPRLRVLIVEDERLIRWSIAETLSHAGHSVIEAEDGAGAVRWLTNPIEPVDAVVLDYRLSDSNDLTLLTSIRRLSPASAVILMTAFGTPDITRGALALGVFRVLDKPFDMGDLPALLLRACGSE